MASNDASNLVTYTIDSQLVNLYYPSSPTEAIISSTSDMIFADTFNTVTCAPDYSGPRIEILIQPTDKFRFRYKSEAGSHGGITGESHNRANKTYPTVKLQNYNSHREVLIKVSLYTSDNNPRPHVLELVGKTCQDGEGFQKLDKTHCAKFQGLSILNKKKDEVLEILKERKKCELNSQVDESQMEEIQEEAKNLNLNAVTLCFEAVFADSFAPVPGCYKVLSHPIFNLKSTFTGDLRICRLSRCTGKCSGDEDIILLCNKIKKDEIQIKFFEKDETDTILWSNIAHFNPVDVHHQVAIPFKTPKYDGQYSNSLTEGDEVPVWIQLLRKSDGKHGEPVLFTYVCDTNLNPKKRKLISTAQNPVSSISCNSPLAVDFSDHLDIHDLFNTTNECLFDNIETITLDHTSSNTYPDFVIKDAVEAEIEEIPSAQSLFFPHRNQMKSSKGSTSEEEISRSFRSMSVKDSDYSVKVMDITETKPERLDRFSNEIKELIKNKDIWYYSSTSVSIQDSDGNSLLHLAIMEKEQNLIHGILKRIQEDLVNHKNFKKETPLHLATCGNHSKLLKLLLHHGGNPHLSNADGNNCLHLASIHNFTECMQVLLTPICIDEEREYSMDINSLNFDGLTPLHLSICHNSEECMKLLLNAKADLNIGDKKCGRSPLHLAVELRSPFVSDLLSQPDVDIDLEDYRGFTALQNACEANNISYENLEPGIKSDKKQIALYLKKLFENEDNSSLYSADESTEETEASDEDFQERVENFLNSASNWKKLGPCTNNSEEDLEILGMLDTNPAKTLIEKMKRMHDLGDTKTELLNILEMARMTDAVKHLFP